MLAPYLPAELLTTAYAAVRRVEDGEARAIALASIASGAERADRDVILQTAADSLQEIGDGGLRVKALAKLVSSLGPEHFEIALDAALGIEGHLDRGNALTLVNPLVPEGLAEKALRGTLAIDFEPSRAPALVALIPRLPETRLASLVDEARRITWEPGRTECLAAIAARLPANERAPIVVELLDQYHNRKPDHMSGKMLVALGPLLTGDGASEGLRLAIELSDDLQCADALQTLAPNLAPDELDVVVESLPALGMWQRSVVRVIASRLDPVQLERTLDACLKGDFHVNHADCVVALFPFLDATLRGRALEASRTGIDVARVITLDGVAQYLSSDVAKAEAEASMQMSEPSQRAIVLAILGSRVEDEHRTGILASSLDAALAIEEMVPRANALVRLLPLLSGSGRIRALRAAFKAARAATQVRRFREPGKPLVALLRNFRGYALAAGVNALLRMEAKTRAESFEGWTPPESHSQSSVIRRVALEHLATLRDGDRATLLRVLALPIFTPPVIPAGAAAGVGRTMVDISTNWEWP
jgi:hypothetical protein